MAYFKVKFTYKCPDGHANSIVKYFRANSMELAEERFPHMLPCQFCLPRTILESPMDVEFDCSEVSELDFRESGGSLEPEVS